MTLTCSLFVLQVVLSVVIVSSRKNLRSSVSEHYLETQSSKSDSAYTRWNCTGENEKRSCLFENLYYTWTGGGKGDFIMLLQNGQKAADVRVLRADKYEGPWTPMAKNFGSDKELEDFLATKHVLEQPGLSVHFNPLFHQNIGHALFDGLYPAYMALVKLGLQDEHFRPVVGVDPSCFDGGAPPEGGKLKPGDVVEAYLPHPQYTKTLQPSKVEVLQVKEESSHSMESDGASHHTMCSFESGLDSSAMELGAQGVSSGEAGKAECCKACEKTWGCTAAVIFANICYMKGNCLKGGGAACDHPANERLMCRFHEDRRPKVHLTVRPRNSSASSPILLQDEVAIPGTWVVGRDRLRCMSEGIYEKFGMSDSILRLFEMDRDLRANPNIIFRFDRIALGSGGQGNLIADESGAIGGSTGPTNAMAHFRDRMLHAYGLPVNSQTSDTHEVTPSKPLDIIVVNNKRFNNEDEDALNSVINHIKSESRGKVNIELIDWGNIGTPEDRFREHLKRVQQADVYVSSIGTALQYVPFMKDQKVYVALGTVWQRANQLFPTFMEQQLAGGGTPYLRTLYADPGAALRNGWHQMIGEDGYRAHINGTVLLELLEQAQTLAKQGFKTPVPVKDNLSKEGQVLLELCQEDPAACKEMNADRNGRAYECAVILWPECVVYEVGPWRDHCHVNRNLLRQLRKKHGLFAYGAPEM